MTVIKIDNFRTNVKFYRRTIENENYGSNLEEFTIILEECGKKNIIKKWTINILLKFINQI